MRLSKRRFITAAAASSTLLVPLGRPGARAAATPPLALRAQRTATGLGWDGTGAAPVLRIVKGSAVDLSVTNGLDAPFVLQWHGLRALNAVAGEAPLAGDPIAPGATAAIRFIPSDSGLSWFHPAPLPGRADLTAQGLRGALIVAEPEPPVADKDLLVILADGRPGTDAAGAVTVNGKSAPEQATIVTGGRLRLRVLNASTTRALILGIEGGRPLIVAIDGQPSDLFEPVKDAVPIGPGARFEFMIDAPREAGGVLRLLLRSDGDKPLLACMTEGAAREALPPVAALPRNRDLSPAIPLEQSARADLVFERVEPGAGPARWRVNGAALADLPVRPLLSTRRGSPVTLGLDNRSTALVAFRLHGHVMRLLHPRDDGWEPYWRDSVLLLPGSRTHVAFVADNPGKWLLDSAFFDQAAFGLRHWFEVT